MHCVILQHTLLFNVNPNKMFLPSLPLSRLEHVTELLLYDNMLESLPDSLFHMKSLEMLNVDRNHLAEIPNTVSNRSEMEALSLYIHCMIVYTVDSPNSGHFGTTAFVLYLESVLYWGVHVYIIV